MPWYYMIRSDDLKCNNIVYQNFKNLWLIRLLPVKCAVWTDKKESSDINIYQNLIYKKISQYFISDYKVFYKWLKTE